MENKMSENIPINMKLKSYGGSYIFNVTKEMRERLEITSKDLKNYDYFFTLKILNIKKIKKEVK